MKNNINGWETCAVFSEGRMFSVGLAFICFPSKAMKAWSMWLALADCFCHCSVIRELREQADLIFDDIFQ